LSETGEKTSRSLILGYGNVDRGDDGLGYHVVNAIAHRFGHPDVEAYSDLPSVLADTVDVLFQRQLTPEMADILEEYDQVVFVDAHTGAYQEEVRFVEVEPGYVPSALTHHLSPETLLVLTAVLAGHAPRGYLCSARGYEFDFSNELSARTKELAELVIEQVLTLVSA
jgi:hydrogenase maturation protease